MIIEPSRATMTYLIRVSVNPDQLLQTYADSQGLEIKDLTEDVESILVSEMGWLDCSGVSVIGNPELLEEKQK